MEEEAFVYDHNILVELEKCDTDPDCNLYKHLLWFTCYYTQIVNALQDKKRGNPIPEWLELEITQLSDFDWQVVRSQQVPQVFTVSQFRSFALFKR
jgi:hypothetical protein